jgi:hypothetical protein
MVDVVILVCRDVDLHLTSGVSWVTLAGGIGQVHRVVLNVL